MDGPCHRSRRSLGRAAVFPGAAALLCLFWSVSAGAAVVSYQKGDGKGAVSETDDTTLFEATPDTPHLGGADTLFEIDLSPHGHAVLKFPNIFGGGPNQIPYGSVIVSASLTLVLDNDGTDCPLVYQLIEGWTEAEATWNSRQTGVGWTVPGAEGASHKPGLEGTFPCTLPPAVPSARVMDVTTSVQNWSNGEPNEGWVFVNAANNDGIDYRTSEHATVADRPLLSVTFARQVFYSVGTNAADLKNGAPTLTIAAGVATLTVAQPDHIGVGDEITYNGATRAFISGRVSSTVYSVTDRLGVPPPDIGPGIVVNSIRRAFNTLKDAALDSDLGTHLGTADLVTAGIQLNWPCYADGPDPSHYVRIEEPWITGPDHYIRVYTPTDPSEVGTSQRHTGVAGSGYRIRPTGPAGIDFFNFILVSNDFGQVRVEGLEIDGSGLTRGENVRGLMANDGPTCQDVHFTHNLIHDITNSTIDDSDTSRVIGIFLDDCDNSRVANNIIYNLTSVSANASGQARGIEGNDAGKTHHVYNNTIYNVRATVTTGSATGILDAQGGTILARNNYVGLVESTKGGEACFQGPFAAENNNVSSDGTALDASSRTGQSNYAAYFVSTAKGSENLHLQGDSLALWGANGADLDGDPVLPVTDDVDGEARDPATPDIGADEYSPGVFYSVGTNAADLKTGSPTITVSSGLATLSVAQTADIGVGDEIDYDSPSQRVFISAVVGPTQLRVLTAAGNLPVDVPGPGVAVNTIRRAFNSFAAASAGSLLPTHLGSGDLVALDRRLTWVGYDDGPFSVGATTLIDDAPGGYTTGAGHFITLTVAGAAQVATGSSQRHRGIAGTGARMEVTAGGVDALDVRPPFTRIEWLEIDGNDNAGVRGVQVDGTADRAVLRSLLIHNVTDDGVHVSSGADGVEVRNTIVYDYGADGVHVSGNDAVIANSTFYLGRTTPASNSVQTDTGATASVYNVLAVGPETDFWENTAPGLSLYNCISTSTTACDFDVSGSCLTGVPPENEFASLVGTINLHLRAGASSIDFGRDLSTSFADDVDGQTRPLGAAWDVGADESVFPAATALYRSVGITTTNLNTASRNVTISGWTATFDGPMPDNVGVGDVLTYVSGGNRLAFISGRSSSTVFTVTDKNGALPTAATNVGVGVYRAYNGLAEWENGIENPNILEPVENDVNPSTDLVTAGTIMMVACYGDGEDVGSAYIDSWETGPDNYIRIYTPVFPNEVGRSQRHNGAWDTSAYRLLQDTSYFAPIGVRERYVRIDGLQLTSNEIVATESNGIHVGDSNADLPVEIHISNNIVRSTTSGTPLVAFGIGALNSFGETTLDNSLYVARVWNNIVYGYVATNSSTGIYAAEWGTMYAYNNTVVGTGAATHRGIAQFNNTIVHAKNNISIDSADPYRGVYSASSTNNFSDLGDAPGLNPKTRNGAGADPVFVGALNYHLDPSDTWARDQGADLSSDADLAFATDIDLGSRQAPWDVGADDASATTAVVLLSFEARPADAAVDLEWRTGSELDNLGFHLHRGPSAGGPWTRVTTSLIPGLGSSPEGASYSFRDGGLVNGSRYFYLLEDIDTASVSTFHGPVSAVPGAPAGSEAGEGGGSEGGGSEGGGDGSGEAADDGSADPSDGAADPGVDTYGDPSGTSVRLLSRSLDHTLVELYTPGFYAWRDPSGRVRVSIPGFDEPEDPRSPALPVRRLLLDAVVGREARIASVQAADVVSYPDLVPAALGYPEMDVRPDGTLRPARREASLDRSAGGFLPPSLATSRGTAFQGETKKLALELAPLRYDTARNELVLARRLRVRVDFVGVDTAETGWGTRGRRAPRLRAGARHVLGFLYTSEKGLHAVSFEALFPGQTRPHPLLALSLERQGEKIPFHIEPVSSVFGPGSLLYFYADRLAPSDAFTGETAYELVRSAEGVRMASVSAAPFGDPVPSSSLGWGEWETNRIYQPGLLEAPDRWLWDAAVGGTSRSQGFSLSGLDPASPSAARITVHLQGGSDAADVVDHHLRFWLGPPGERTYLGEASIDGKQTHAFEVSVPPALLREGPNELTVENLGDTGVYSLVFLDRFSVEFPQLSALHEGRLEGVFADGGVLEISDAEQGVGRSFPEERPGRGTRRLVGGFSPLRALDLTDPAAPLWLTSLERAGSSVRVRVEAGRRYVFVAPGGLLSPRVGAPARSTLRSPRNQADYILIAAEAFLPAAEPLLHRRRDQGLTTLAVSFETLSAVFGHGQASAQAVRDFLAFAFHHWTAPAPRYVLLLGDASYDPRNFSGSADPAPLPAMWARTSYLWTASDPTLAAVNGEDPLPDIALGRLPASTVEQAEVLVAKILDWEESAQDLSGRVLLVADDPDDGGDFEADVLDIARSFLTDRETTTLKIRELGGATRAAILDAMDQGASLVSYVGHGGSAVWASENVLNSWDTPSLRAQPRQPFMLTLNCLNGYFVAPTFDSLAEAFLKAEGRGTIAAFSPSGLSLDGPAHVFHRTLMQEITRGGHERLGDAVLASQEAFAEQGLMPELLSVYHLFGDPAMRIQP